MFSESWEKTYAEGGHNSVWPWSDLVSFFFRHRKLFPHPIGSSLGVLELGCGAGANVPFFLSLGVDYLGVDGSPSIIQKLKERFPDHDTRFLAKDFTTELPRRQVSNGFNVIVDRASLTHNDTPSIHRCLENLAKICSPKAIFLGIDWFSTAHDDSKLGTKVDTFTRTDLDNTQFHGLGRVHFSTEGHLRELFSEHGFVITTMEHKVISTVIPRSHQFASYNFVAEFQG